MNKMIYIFIILFLLTMCNRNSSQSVVQTNNDLSIDNNVFGQNQLLMEINESDIMDSDISAMALLGFSRANLVVRYTEENNFIGYIDLNMINPDIKIGGVYIYEKYIVLEEFYESENVWFTGGFNVYEFNPDIKITEYWSSGNRIYSCIGEPYCFQGIHNDYLFIDIGTGPGLRGIKVFDLKNNEIMLSALYDNRFYFQNNIVSGLVISEWNIMNNSEDIITIFFNYRESAEIPEETSGLFPEFIVYYTYNILTKEIEIVSGRYILSQ